MVKYIPYHRKKEMNFTCCKFIDPVQHLISIKIDITLHSNNKIIPICFCIVNTLKRHFNYFHRQLKKECSSDMILWNQHISQLLFSLFLVVKCEFFDVWDKEIKLFYCNSFLYYKYII